MSYSIRSLLVLTIGVACTFTRDDNNWGSQQENSDISKSSWENVFENNDGTPLPLYRYEKKLYYMGTNFKARWLDALHFCESIHMKLLTIHSSEENERIHKYIREASKGPNYWTGGARLIDGKSWIWMPYATSINYTKWATGQPNNANEKCLQLSITRNELTWSDKMCTVEFYFICERYMDSDTSGPSGIRL